MSEWTGRRSRKRIVCWVGARTLEVPPDHRLKLLKCSGLYVELPLQVGAHLALHLVDLPERKHSLTDDAPRFVGVCVIADDLGSNHKGRDEQAVPGGTARGDEPCLQSLQQVESSKGHRGREPGTMEGVSNEMREIQGSSAGGRRQRLVGAMEEGVYVAGTHPSGLLMAVEIVLKKGVK